MNRLYVDKAYDLDAGELVRGGFVELVGLYGDDIKSAEVARISYKQADKKNVRSDKKLVEYLWANKHTSPFEFVEAEFIIRMPIFVARQFFRHRTANVNEMSMRYSQALPLVWMPDTFRIPDKVNKQGSSGIHSESNALLKTYMRSVAASYISYMELLYKGVAKEQARAMLPVAMYTEVRWKQDFKNLAHLLALRLDHHAQWETRLYAMAMYLLLEKRIPGLIGLFDRYSINGYTLTLDEIKRIAISLREDNSEPIKNSTESKSRRKYLLDIFDAVNNPDLAPNADIVKLKREVLEFNKGEPA